MSEVGIRELKASASEIIRQMRKRGVVVDIIYHGKVIARLSCHFVRRY